MTLKVGVYRGSTYLYREGCECGGGDGGDQKPSGDASARSKHARADRRTLQIADFDYQGQKQGERPKRDGPHHARCRDWHQAQGPRRRRGREGVAARGSAIVRRSLRRGVGLSGPELDSTGRVGYTFVIPKTSVLKGFFVAHGRCTATHIESNRSQIFPSRPRSFGLTPAPITSSTARS